MFLPNVKSCQCAVISLQENESVLILNAETMFGVLVFIAMFANVIGTILGGSDNWSK